MFELIGFWIVVCIATLIIVFPAVMVAYIIAVKFVARVTGNSQYKAMKLVDKYVDIDTDNGFFICRHKIFPEPFVFIFGIFGFLANMILLIHSCERGFTYGESLLMFVSRAGEVLSTPAIYVMIPVTLYYGSAYLVAKGVKLKAKLDTISSKLKDES